MRDSWDNMFEEVPASFEARMKETLSALEEKPKIRRFRFGTGALVAAALLVAVLGGTALATDFFGLKSLTVTDPNASPAAVSATAEPVSDSTVIALQGVPGSPEFKANAEWMDFLASYDTAAMAKPIPLHPRHPERICWGCDRYCAADALALSDEELARRRAEQDARGWKPAEARPRKVSAALKAYAKLVTSADKGAVRDLSLLDCAPPRPSPWSPVRRRASAPPPRAAWRTRATRSSCIPAARRRPARRWPPSWAARSTSRPTWRWMPTACAWCARPRPPGAGWMCW